MQIIIDTREQRPVLYDKSNANGYDDLQISFETLKTGDYSVKGMSDPATCKHSICIERKSLPDLFQSLGRGRKRFEKELFRMSKFDFSCIVIEGSFFNILNNPPEMSSMSTKAVFRSLLAFQQRYGVHVMPCHDRAMAERVIYLTLKRFFDDRQKKGKMNFDGI